MPLPTIATRYIASPKSWKADEFNGAPILDMLFQLRQMFDANSNSWIDVTGDLEISKRFFLKKNDGSWSEHTLDSLVDSLGWDGKSLKTLVEPDWTQVEVQLSIGYTERNGKSYIGVDFMNPRDYEGRTLASDPAVVQSLEAKYGGELRSRAIASGKKPVAKAPTAAQKVLKPTTPDEAKKVAWAQFKAKSAFMTDEQRKASWIESLAHYANGKNPSTLTINDWDNITNQIAEFGPYKKPEPQPEPELETVPADDAPILKEEDIPF